MHTLDCAVAVLGALADVSALATRQYPRVHVEGESEDRVRGTFDHLLAQARLASGGALGVEVVGGRPAEDTPFRLEVFGDKGRLTLEGGTPRGFQSGRLRLQMNGLAQDVDLGELEGLPEEAVNVAATYGALRDDIVNGTSTVPDFGHAVRLTRLLDDVLASFEQGRRVTARDWPL